MTKDILIFLVGSGFVWFCAARMTKYLDVIAERTGIGRAFAGILFLGLATSLPEIATTTVASYSGSAELAVSNLMGGVAIQITVLAVIDFVALRGKALTSRSPNAALLMQGVILILVLSLALMSFSTGETVTFLGIGFWPLFIFFIYGAGLFAVHRYEGDPRWEPVRSSESKKEVARYQEEVNRECGNVPTKILVLKFLLCAIVVLVSGYFVTTSAEGIVEKSGIGGHLVGATLLALATSLPEVTTTWSAVRLGAYSMAIGSILGTNTLEVALLLPADIFYREGAIIEAADNRMIFLGSLGIILTCLYLWGILERRDRTVLRMGIDSLLIIFVYFIGMGIYSFL